MNKKELRKVITQKKKNCSQEQLKTWSSSLLNKLEVHPDFVHAQKILFYYSLPDEVQTHDFIERWKNEKEIILPVVVGETELELRRYTGRQDLAKGAFGIEEPVGKSFEAFQEIDLAIIPGVSFDHHGNRLGRGRGYYDRLLPKIKAKKIGICYGFQVSGLIPTDKYDFPMDAVLTEEGILFPTDAENETTVL